MSDTASIDARPFNQILHLLLRQDELGYDPEEHGKVVAWLQDHGKVFGRVCSGGERIIIDSFLRHWNRHKTPPDRVGIEEIIRQTQKNQSALDSLALYDQDEDNLRDINVLDLSIYYDTRVADFERYQVFNALSMAQNIVLGAVPDPKVKEKTWEGPRDALKWVSKRVGEGILVEGVVSQGGLLSETTDKIRERYDQRVTDRRDNNLYLPTGIGLIDKHLGGLRRKELNGVLGFVGQRKSAVCRSIAYHVASLGFRVLHIPCESDYEEEETIYTAMHANADGRELIENWRGDGISVKRIDGGLLSAEEEARYFNTIVPSYQRHIAENITVLLPSAARDWNEVKDMIERENDKQPIDLCIIDYLTMLSTPGARDDKADKQKIIQEVKAIALTANDGKGMCFLTPVQGNRAGFDAAAQNDGAWSTTGIHLYSELDKSLDNLFYIFFNDEMNIINEAKIGSCKCRREANIPATVVSIDPRNGRVWGKVHSEEIVAPPVTNKSDKKGDKQAEVVQPLIMSEIMECADFANDYVF